MCFRAAPHPIAHLGPPYSLAWGYMGSVFKVSKLCPEDFDLRLNLLCVNQDVVSLDI